MSAVWIPVLASMKGFVSEVNRGASQAGKAAGSSIKKDLEDAGQQGGKSAADAMAQQFQVASTKVAAARKKEAGAASDLAVAEEQLNQVRAQGDATAGQIMAAEAKVDDARRRQETAASRLGAAEQDLQSVRDGGESRVTSVVSAEQALEDARLKAQAAADKVRVSEQQAQDARSTSLSATQAAESAEVQLALAKAEHGEGSKQANQAERELAKARRESDKATIAAEKAEGGVGRARADSKTATESAEGAELKLQAAKEKAAQSAQKAGNEAQTAGSKVRGMGDDMAGAEPKTSSLGGSLMGLAGKAGGLALAFTGISGVVDTFKAGFAKNMALEDTEASLRVLTGSAEQAEIAIQGLRDTNDGTPMSFDVWADAGKTLIAFGLEADKAGATVEALGEAAAATGKGEEALNSMATALGNAMTQGNITTDALNTLATGGVEGLKILANEFGVTTDEMQKMVSAGTVPAAEAVDVLTKGIIEGSEGAAGATKAMGGVMAELGDTTSGRIARMKSAFTNLGADIMASLGPAIAVVAEKIMDGIKWVRGFIEAAKEKKGLLIALGVAIGAFAAGLAAVQIAAFASRIMLAGRAYLAMYKAVGLARSAQILFNGAVLANPLVWIVAALVAVGAALVWFFTQTETGKKAWSAFTDFLGAAWEKIKGFFTAAWDAIKPVWDGIVDGAKRVWETIKPVFEWIGQAWQNLVGWFQDGGFESALGRIGEVFELAFTPVRWLIDQLREAWEWATEAIAAKYEQNVVPMLDAFKEKWQQAKDIIAPFIDTIKDKWETFSTAVKEFYDTNIAPAIDAFKDKFGELIGKVQEFVAEYWEPYLKPALMFLAAILLGPVVLAFMLVIGVIGLVIGIIMGLIYVVVSLPGWVKGAVEGVKQWFQDMWANVKQWFSDMGESISNWWNEHVATLPGKVSGAIQSVKDYFSDLWQSIKDWFREMGQAVSDWWNNYVAPLPGQVGTAVEGVLNWFRNLPSNIKQLFADAGQWLVSAGQRILNGLWEGMKQKWADLKGWLSDKLSFSSIGSLIGLSGGGIVVMADGGITQYAQGGIDRLESYANGGGRENHTAQIAPAGAWRVWAEDETGGEAYIPLASSKRGRSTAILDEVAGRFGYDLVDSATGQPYAGGYSGDLGPQHVTQFADGAVVTSDDFTRFVHGGDVGGEKASGSLEGWQYQNYPSDPGAWGDCSYTVGKVSALAVGKRTAGRHFATGTQGSALSSWGFTRGRGAEGDLLIGFKNGGPGGGHTSGTLPDGTNFEMGGARGNGQIGGGAAGAWDSYYTDFFHMPVGPTFENVELDGMGEFGDFADPYGVGYSPVSEAEAITADAAGTSDEPTTISGMFGKVAQEAVSGQVADFLSVIGAPDELPSWAVGAREAHSAYTTPRTSVAEEHAEANQDAAVTSMTADQINANPQLSGMDSMDVTSQPEVPEWGPEFFAYEISRQAKGMDLSADGAKIGIATALVESGDPMKMYANNAVPESLNYRHDAVGSDHDSVGLFQQRNNGAWGTTAERMDPFDSAGMFFRELVKFDWESMDPGAAAQKVQRSAHPDRYGQRMSRAEDLVAGTGLYSPVADAEAITAEAALAEDTALYDQGGVLDHEKLALNLSGKPEAVLTNDQWQMLSGLGESLPDMVGSTVSGTVSSGITAAAGMANTVMPGAGAAFGPAAQLGGWYAGEVASGWTSAIMQAGQQAFSALTEPLEDIAGRFTAPAPVVNGPAPTLGAIPERRENDDKGDRPRGESIVINVNSVEEAIELKKHLEARQLLGLGKR